MKWFVDWRSSTTRVDLFVMQDRPDGAFVTVGEHKLILQPTAHFGYVCTTARVSTSRPAGEGKKKKLRNKWPWLR